MMLRKKSQWRGKNGLGNIGELLTRSHLPFEVQETDERS